MSEDNLSKYERLVANLGILESRNPDLGKMLTFLDLWIDQFVKGNHLQATFKSTETSKNHELDSEVNRNQPLETQQVNEKSLETAQSDVAVANNIGVVFTEENNITCTVSKLTGEPSGREASEKITETALKLGIDDDSLAQESTVASVVSTGSSTVAGSSFWREEDIIQLEKRLLLKIEASRWALERDRLLKTSVDFQSEIEPRDHALLTRARELTNCYLWMNNPETAPVIANDTYEMLADAYSAAAVCVGFMRELIDLVDRSPKSEILSRILRDALYITATAQSALRRVTYDVSGREDQDQIRIHRWLTFLTKRYSIYVNRHMKKDSLAPKERIYVIPDYIERLRKEVEKLGQRQKILTEGFRRIQYHVARIQNQGGEDHDWTKIINTVDDLIDAGISANDARFEEMLKGILRTLPEVPSYKEHPFFINVLMELDYWHENEDEKALVKRELTETPPQPKVTAGSDDAKEYTSVWDEMERNVTPGKFLSENGKMFTNPESTPSEKDETGNGGNVAETTPQVQSAPHTLSLTRDEILAATAGRTDKRNIWERGGETSEFRSGLYNGTSDERKTTFANFSSAKKAQGFGSGILTRHTNENEENPRNAENAGRRYGRDTDRGMPRVASSFRTASDSVSRSVTSGHSRFSNHNGIPSYASVVSENAHSHHEAEVVPYEPAVTSENALPEIPVEELLAQVQKIIGGKTIILVDGSTNSTRWSEFVKCLNGMVVLADEEQITSEVKLAQLLHPGNVAAVMLVDGTVATSNRSVENYCRRFDKPLLRVEYDLNVSSFARKIKAAMVLWR